MSGTGIQRSNGVQNSQYSDFDYVAQPKKPNPFYKTTNQEYDPTWQLTQDSSIRDYTVPTFGEVLEQRQNFYKMEKTLKNSFTDQMNKKNAPNFEAGLTEYDRMKLKLDKNAVVGKEFPFKPEEFKYPEPGINVGNELYMTSNMDYGRLKPSGYEVNSRWFPNNNTFTKQLPGGPYQNNSLRTTVTRNRVNDYLDGFN